MGVSNAWASNGSEGTSITVYTSGELFGSAWDTSKSYIKIHVRRGTDDWMNYATMTETGKTYNGKKIYSYTFKEKWDGAQIYFEHWKTGSGSRISEYGTDWANTSTLNGKLYLGYMDNGHRWATLCYDATIYFLKNGKASSWTTLKAHAWNEGYSSVTTTWPGTTMTNTQKTYDGNPIYSVTFSNPPYSKVIFNQGNNTNQSGEQTIPDHEGKIFDYNANKWIDYTYDVTVTFKANGGTGSDYTQTVKYNTSTTLTANKFTRTGYSFNGWKTAANSGTSYANQASVKFTANTTLYAQWTPAKYTITYKDQNNATFSGSHATGYPTQHTYGTATTLKTASKTGYTFEGWYKESACTNKVTSLGATAYTANITLYAKWTINQYTLDFGAGEGGSVTATVGGKEISSPATLNYGTSVKLTATPSGENAFAQWVNGSGGKVSTANPYTITLTSNKTLKAEFSKPTTVYLKPSHSWKSNNAQFAVKYGGTNHMMIEVEECCEEKYYKVTIPSQYSKFNFVRLSNNRTTEWNVTGEISVPTDGKNLYDMTKIYLKPNGNWKSGNARFAAYFFDSQDNLNKNKWMSMLPTDEDGIFYCDFPTDHIFDRVSLTRMNGAESYNDWAYRWNQTKDIDLFQGYNSYELEEGKWGKDNSEPQVDDNMDVIYKCKWTTYNPTYSVTLEPTPYGHYTVEYNGRTYKSATDKNVVIEDVALGATIRVSKGTPDNSAEYTDDMLLQKASGSGKTELKGGEYYDHTICGTTTITENFVTKNPHTVYLRVPTTVEAAWNDDDQGLSQGANCVYYTHIMAGGIHIMDNVTNSINGEDGYSYYQLTIPAGYRTFCFQRKSKSEPQNYLPRNYTKDFTHILPFINGLNCFTILGSDDDYYYYGEWGTLLQDNDYRLLYIEQKVKEENGHPNTIVTKAHPSDIIKYNDTRTTYSLHIYNKVENGENGMNDPEILVQQWDGSKWITKERHMVFGPLHAGFDKAAMPGRRDAVGDPDAVLRYDNGIENIKNDTHADNGSGVWNFIVTRDGDYNFKGLDLTETKRYTGEYYIRTNVAFGEWNSYKGSDNHMTRSDVSKQHSNYSHYYCKWVATDGANLKYTIANDYGMAISDTLVADETDIWGTPIADAKKIVTDGTLPTDDDKYGGANVRFSWNEKSNFLHRAYLAGSTDVSSRFLVLEGKSDQIYNAEGNVLAAGVDNGTDPRYGLNANEEIFNDISNWVYYADVQLVPNADLRLTAKYMDKEQYFIGQEDDQYNNTVLAGTGSQKYLIRLLYDFKTNELISAYVPGGNTNIDAIQTNLMLLRKENETPRQLSFNVNDMEDVGKQAYGVLELTKATLIDNTQGRNIYERSLYWISFPFDVRITDIFGFGEYGKHWIIQSYDGQKRADNGLWTDSETNWVYHFDPNTLNAGTPDQGIMKRGVGYVVALDLDQIKADNPFVGRINTLALYFPSTNTITKHIVNRSEVIIPVPEHVCTINRNTPKGDRRVKDSHWNVIGVPSYINAVGNFGNIDGKFNHIELENRPGQLQFYYRWLGDYDKYEVTTPSATVNFNSLTAYMVQYAGDLTWTSVLNEGPASLAAKRNSDDMKQHHLRLELQQNGTEQDRTFIQLQEDEVTAGFDFNYDLCKINNSGANIYSLIATDTYPVEVAGNVMPVQETVIPVGIKLDAAGEYTFAMPDGTDGIVAELIDYEANTTTNLLFNDYTVNLPKGTFENRFALSVKPDKTATSLENIFNEATGDEVKKFIIDGVLYMQKDGVLYDAQGHIVR